jgi:hypothetical protein
MTEFRLCHSDSLRSVQFDDSHLFALYFISFECVYLLWPWFSGVVRSAVAVLPLVCLYLAEGPILMRRSSRQNPRKLGLLFLPVSLLLGFLAVRVIWPSGVHHGFQEKISAVFWIACAILCVRLIWKGPFVSWSVFSPVQRLLEKHFIPRQLRLHPPSSYCRARSSLLRVHRG